MIEYLGLIFVIALLCNGVDLVTSEHYFGHPFRRFLTYILKPYKKPRPFWSYLYEPLIGCIVCMASIWGSFFYWGLYYIFAFDNSLILYVSTLLCVAVVNPIISNQIDRK